MAMLSQFLHVAEKFEIPRIGRSNGQRYHFNSLRISAIDLKFSGIMHSTIKQIAI